MSTFAREDIMDATSEGARISVVGLGLRFNGEGDLVARESCDFVAVAERSEASRTSCRPAVCEYQGMGVEVPAAEGCLANAVQLMPGSKPPGCVKTEQPGCVIMEQPGLDIPVDVEIVRLTPALAAISVADLGCDWATCNAPAGAVWRSEGWSDLSVGELEPVVAVALCSTFALLLALAGGVAEAVSCVEQGNERAELPGKLPVAEHSDAVVAKPLADNGADPGEGRAPCAPGSCIPARGPFTLCPRELVGLARSGSTPDPCNVEICRGDAYGE